MQIDQHARGARFIEVDDLRTCERWLSMAPLADPEKACTALTVLLEDLEDAPPPDGVWLEILDRLSDATSLAIEEQTKRFSGRPVPLTGAEIVAFNCVYDLLTVYGRGYKRLFCAAVDSPNAPIAKLAERLAVRATLCCHELAIAHYRARRELTAEVWEELNEIYRLAEQEGFATKADPLASPARSCEQLYVETTLTHLAQPYGRNAIDLRLILSWARKWAAMAKIRSAQSESAGTGVDLESDEPPTYRKMGRGFNQPWTRVIDLRVVKQALQNHIRAIEKGETPLEPGFTDGQNGQDVLPLLHHLQKAWFAFARARRFKRRIVTDRVGVVTGIREIFPALGGDTPKPKAPAERSFSRLDYERFRIFGRVGDEREGELPARPRERCSEGGAAERWDLLDENPLGFRVRRREVGSAIHHRQLVAIKPPNAKAFVLADARWLMMGVDGTVTLGLEVLAGLPQPVTIQAASSDAKQRDPENPGVGFLLSPIAGCKASLVALRGAFAVGAIVDILVGGTTKRVQLTDRLGQGHDYDQFSYSSPGAARNAQAAERQRPVR
ncbi:MAG: hypothetical protein ACKVQU_07570 [Burkholderiales bacterium]